MTVPDTFTHARVVQPPRRVLVRTGDREVWTAELLYWLRGDDGAWWGHVEAIPQEHRVRRGVIAARYMEPFQPGRVEAHLDQRWEPGELLGWRTVIDERRRHGWEGLVDVTGRSWKRDQRWVLWFAAGKIRGASPPPGQWL